MFTGLIQSVGEIREVVAQAVDTRLHVALGRERWEGLALGDSIAVNGCCLTATALTEAGFWADVSAETLALTVLGGLHPGDPVNLEPALRLSDRLGGHLVSGHVDGVGRVLAFAPEGRSWRLQIEAPAELARYIAHKGSICVDGVSLTVNGVTGARFDINLVPHTLARTTLRDYQLGRRVNLEVDMLARYLERLLQGEAAASGISHQTLAQAGFITIHD